MQKSKLSLFTLLATVILCLSSLNAFELTATTCDSSSKQQSPININTTLVEYHEEEYFRLISQNFTGLNTYWSIYEDDKAIGFNADVGSLIFVKDWAMHQFDLEKVLIRYGSGHKIDDMEFDLEMEFVLNYNEDYRSPGRYIYAGVDKLIISVFFVGRTQEITEEDTENENYSFFFNITNLDDFANNIANDTVLFEKDIKLNYLIKQQPGYFYQGTEANGNCESVWRLILPKYQVVPSTQIDTIASILESLGFIDTANGVTSNARDIQTLSSSTTVIRSDDSTTRLLIEASSQQYNSASFLSGVLISIICFFIILL